MVKQFTLQDDELQLVQRNVLGGWPQYSANVPLKTKTDQDIKGAKALSSGRLTLRTGVPIPGRRQTQRLSRNHHYRRLLHDQTSPRQEGPLGRSTVPDNAS
ncbi:unnamed protein product [Boreogadus saida]